MLPRPREEELIGKVDRDSGRYTFGAADVRRQNAEFPLTGAKLAMYPRNHLGKPKATEIK